MTLLRLKTALILIALMGLSFTYNQLQETPISDYELSIPEGFPTPIFPKGNELTQERIALGRMLFYDPVLSIDSTISCATCHQAAYGFADHQKITPGVGGALAMRNAPTLTNVAYNPTFMFDGFLKTLEMQLLVPIQEHAEFNHNIVEIAKILQKDTLYTKMSLAAYNRIPDPFVITRSISSFERTLISGNSKFDQDFYQGKHTLNKSEKRGMDLFFNTLHCTTCHNGFNFTDFSAQNNGLYETYKDSGKQRATKLPEDKALFKVPTLRNIALTAPYMHDGSMATLVEVISHYETGGASNPQKHEILQPFTLSKREKRDLLRFLHTLTDYSFIQNKVFQSPFIK